MAVTINMKELLDAGVHYGHQTRRWNPKMQPYIFGSRNGIHIIDLQKTVKALKSACDFIESTTAKGGHVLFVGTKRIAQEIVAKEAERSGMYYMNQRWLGGTLTNFNTIRQSIHRLKRFEKMSIDGTLAKLTKKEALDFERQREKLNTVLGGIKDMPGLPSVIFIIDAHQEQIAVKEANKLGIPVVAIADTNCDPTEIQFPVPGNDDSFKSIQMFTQVVAESILAGKSRVKDFAGEKTAKSKVQAGIFKQGSGHAVAVEKKATVKKPEKAEDAEPVKETETKAEDKKA